MPTAIPKLTPDQQAAKKEADAVATRAKAVTIRSRAQYEEAGLVLVEIKRARKRIADAFGPVVAAAHKAWKAAKGLHQQAEAELVEAEAALKPAMARYAEAERRRDEDKRRKAEAEARAKAEEARKRQADAYAAAGHEKAAEALLQAPVAAPTVAMPTRKAPAGIHTVETWRAEVIDMVALCKAIGAGEQPPELVQPNSAALNEMARAAKANMSVPGVRAFSTTGIAARA